MSHSTRLSRSNQRPKLRWQVNCTVYTAMVANRVSSSKPIKRRVLLPRPIWNVTHRIVAQLISNAHIKV